MVDVAPNYRPVQAVDRSNWARGFTLVELMIVVVIITALAGLAVPSILKQMQDRRTRQAAEEIASIYRQARLRALGRGAAVMVRYSSTTGFQLREAVMGGGGTCARLPVSSCSTTQWGQGPTVVNGDQLISQFSPSAGVYAGVSVAAHASAPTAGGGSAKVTDPAVSALDICFTPMGRALFGIAGGTPPPTLLAMTGVPLISVSRDTGGLTRLVVIPPNGLARLDVSQ